MDDLIRHLRGANKSSYQASCRSKRQLVINLQSARTPGLTIPIGAATSLPLGWVPFRPITPEEDDGTGRIEVAEHRCR